MSHHVWHRALPALVGHEHEHVHSHGLVDPSIVRSRAGVKAVAISLGVLGATAAVQAVIAPLEDDEASPLLGQVVADREPRLACADDDDLVVGRLLSA